MVTKNRPSRTSRNGRMSSLDLMPVLGFGYEHAGEERAQGQRQAGSLREPRKAPA